MSAELTKNILKTVVVNVAGANHSRGQFDPDPKNNPNNPDLRPEVHDPRLKVRGPRTLVLGPWPSDQDSGKVAGKVLTVDL